MIKPSHGSLAPVHRPIRWKNPCLPGLQAPVLTTLLSYLMGHLIQPAHPWEACVLSGEQPPCAVLRSPVCTSPGFPGWLGVLLSISQPATAPQPPKALGDIAWGRLTLAGPSEASKGSRFNMPGCLPCWPQHVTQTSGGPPQPSPDFSLCPFLAWWPS